MRTLLYSSALSLVMALSAGYASANTYGSSAAQGNQQMGDQSMSGQSANATNASGMSRATVRSIQQSLNQEGYKTSVDGMWGPNTASALKSFQSANGITPTGKPNSQTLQALNVTPNGGGSDMNNTNDMNNPNSENSGSSNDYNNQSTSGQSPSGESPSQQ